MYSLLHVEPKTREPECDPCDTNTVLSAIRETRFVYTESHNLHMQTTLNTSQIL